MLWRNDLPFSCYLRCSVFPYTNSCTPTTRCVCPTRACASRAVLSAVGSRPGAAHSHQASPNPTWLVSLECHAPRSPIGRLVVGFPACQSCGISRWPWNAASAICLGHRRDGKVGPRLGVPRSPKPRSWALPLPLHFHSVERIWGRARQARVPYLRNSGLIVRGEDHSSSSTPVAVKQPESPRPRSKPATPYPCSHLITSRTPPCNLPGSPFPPAR